MEVDACGDDGAAEDEAVAERGARGRYAADDAAWDAVGEAEPFFYDGAGVGEEGAFEGGGREEGGGVWDAGFQFGEQGGVDGGVSGDVEEDGGEGVGGGVGAWWGRSVSVRTYFAVLKRLRNLPAAKLTGCDHEGPVGDHVCDWRCDLSLLRVWVQHQVEHGRHFCVCFLGVA